MTLQLRPTFSESWYRVAPLKPRLRAAAQISRQFYRDERWYVVRDPAGNQYHRLSDAAYKFVGLLDGSRTVSEAWELVGGQLADDAPTQPEVIQILSQLYSANLIETNITPDAQVLLRRHKRQVIQKGKQRLMNILFPRIPLLDPDWILKMWMPLMRPMLSLVGLFVWLVLVGTACFFLAQHWEQLKKAGWETINFAQNTENAFFLYASFVILKAIHEFGHGFMCRRFGGEVHEMGVMFLVLFPAPYVDASSAWSFQNKWHRILVGAGGMLFEIFVAAIAAFVWLATKDNASNWFITQLAYNVMLIASVTTVVFNINPLLRYDGYYMLSDYLEIPNLQHKSREYSLSLIKRYLFRVKWSQPLPQGLSQKIWMVVYFCLSGPYRVFVGLAIMVYLLWQLPEQVRLLGLLLGMGSVATFLIVPLYKTIKYLTIEPELHRKRTLAITYTLAFAALVIGVVGLLRFPVNVRAEASLEPKERANVFSESSGQVVEVRVKDAQHVEQGDVLLVAENLELNANIQRLTAQVERVQGELRIAGQEDPAATRTSQAELDDLQSRLAYAKSQKDKLTIRAPISGYIVAPQLASMPGQWIGPENKDPIGSIFTSDKLVAVAVVDQRDFELLSNTTAYETKLRLAGDLESTLDPIVSRPAAAASKQLRSGTLSAAAGGTQQADPSDPSGKKLARAQFMMECELNNTASRYIPGQRAYVRFKLTDGQPLLLQGWRKLLQLIQTTKT